jgi:hypothetical protein
VPSEYVAKAASETCWPTPTVAAEGWINIELIEGLMKKPPQDVRNGHTSKLTAATSTSCRPNRVRRCSSAPEKNLPHLSTNELPVPAEPISTPDVESPVLRPHRSRTAAIYRRRCDNDCRLTVSSMVRRLFYQTEAQVSFVSKKSAASDTILWSRLRSRQGQWMFSRVAESEQQRAKRG